MVLSVWVGGLKVRIADKATDWLFGLKVRFAHFATAAKSTKGDCCHSLRQCGGSASTVGADIHITENLDFFLRRRVVARSPIN